MKIGAVVVGFDHWHDGQFFTRTFSHALQDYNPDINVVVVDNASERPYSSERLDIVRVDRRIGYGAALNVGLKHLGGSYDWYVCLNNDCEYIGGTPENEIRRLLKTYDENTLYGSGVNQDTRLPFAWQWSAWLVISRKIKQNVGFFDEELSAAFEDFDFEYRAMLQGFQLDTAKLPIWHLDKHTRYDDPTYPARWDASRVAFENKHRLPMMRWYSDTEIERAK